MADRHTRRTNKGINMNNQLIFYKLKYGAVPTKTIRKYIIWLDILNEYNFPATFTISPPSPEYYLKYVSKNLVMFIIYNSCNRVNVGIYSNTSTSRHFTLDETRFKLLLKKIKDEYKS